MSLRYSLPMALLCFASVGHLCFAAEDAAPSPKLEVDAKAIMNPRLVVIYVQRTSPFYVQSTSPFTPFPVKFRPIESTDERVTPEAVIRQLTPLVEAASAVRSTTAVGKMRTSPHVQENEITTKSRGTFIVRYNESVCPYKDCRRNFATEDGYGNPQKEIFIEHLLNEHTQGSGQHLRCPLTGMFTGIPFLPNPTKIRTADEVALHDNCPCCSKGHLRYHLQTTLGYAKYACFCNEYSTNKVQAFINHLKNEHKCSKAEVNAYIKDK